MKACRLFHCWHHRDDHDAEYALWRKCCECGLVQERGVRMIPARGHGPHGPLEVGYTNWLAAPTPADAPGGKTE